MTEYNEAAVLNSGNPGLAVNKEIRGISIEENAKPADIPKAWEYRYSNMIGTRHNNRFKPLPVIKTTLKDLGKHGVALELYFLAIKKIGFLFLLISVISVWPMYENYIGDGLEEGDKNQVWDVFTLGNQYKFSYDMDKNDAEKIVKSYKNSKIRIVIADLLYTLIFLFFVLYFHITTKEKIRSNHEKYLTVADFAIEISGLPENCTTEEVFKFLGEFGQIKEVYLARRFNGVLSSYQLRVECQTHLNYLQYIGRTDSKNQKELKKINAEIEKIDKSIKEKQKNITIHDNLPVIKGYAIFDDLSDRKQCLKAIKNSNSCCRRYKSRHKFKNFKIKVSPTSEPCNINWENLEYSRCKRFLRSILSFILVLVVLSLSVAAVYAVRSYDNDLPNEKSCLVKYEIETSLSLEAAEERYKTETQKYCYCRVQSIKDIIEDSSLRSFCSYYIEKRSYGILFRFMAVTAVVMINFFMKMIIKYLSRFEKVVSKSQEMKKIMSKVFIAMFINTSLVVLAVNADLSSTWVIDYVPFRDYVFNSEFSDFTRRWYIQAGSTITITMLMSIFSPHLLNYLIFYPRGACKRHCCLKKHKTQLEINRAFKGPDFDIATRYSQVLNVVFTSFLYSGGIPLLNCTCCVTMFILYWTDKYLVLNHYSIPPRYSHELNTNFIGFLPFAGIFHCGFSLYMVGSENIYPEGFHTKNGFLYPNVNTIKNRIVSVCGIIYLGIILIAIFTYLYLSGVKCCDVKNSQVSPCNNIPTFTQAERKIREHGLTSYNIRNNSLYSDLINSMDMAGNEMTRIKNHHKMNKSEEFFIQST